MREFKPNFFLFLFRSYYSMWVILFLVFGLFLSLYDLRNSAMFLVIGMFVIIHAQIFTKKVTIRNDEYIDISFLHGPRIFSFRVADLSGLLLSHPYQTGSFSWGLMFTCLIKGIDKGVRVDFTYWTKDELVKVYNEICVLLPNKK